jgi:hypothetical protein
VMDAPPRLKNRHFSLRILPRDGRNSPNSANELLESKSATLTYIKFCLKRAWHLARSCERLPSPP